ncbi:MAG TPA: serine/threonine-protein kinase [Planctomycetota bacterium]
MAADFDPNAPTVPDRSGSAASSTGPSLAGRKVGDYQVIRELGRGGMGVVYLAHDAALQRDVAIKVLQPDLASDPEFEARFIREARTSAKLEHPNVVPVYTAGRDGDLLYMAMGFVKGRTLDAHLKARGRLPVAEAVDIVRQAARGLGAAHAASLVHRDIKPHNIMIDDAGRVKIMDFGLMRSWRDADAITETGVFYGTPQYASPEQCDSGELDGRSDLYSLGAVFYEMLTGKRPHTGDTPVQLLKKILLEAPATVRSLNPDVPPGVAAVVEKMMAKRAEERFATAEEVVAALDAPKPVVTTSRRPLIAGAAAALVLLAAGWLFLRPAPAVVDPLPPSGRTRLVVFDLKNGIPKPESAWYSIALSDLLIAALSNKPKLDVPTRDTLLWTLKQMELAGKASEDHRRVLTSELGARAYLSGNYYVQSGRIRLTLTGYRLPENSPLFPELSFERPEGDLFGLVDTAAAAVAKALLGEVAPSIAAAGEPEDAKRREQLRGGGAREREKAPAAPTFAAKPAAPLPTPAPVVTAAPTTASAALKEEKKNLGAEDGKPGKAKAAAEIKPAEWAHAWYANRKALETCKLGKEDFQAAAQQLAQEFRRKAPDQAALAGPRRSDADKDAAKRMPDWLEFACPGCEEPLPGFERCEPCERFAVVRLKKRTP